MKNGQDRFKNIVMVITTSNALLVDHFLLSSTSLYYALLDFALVFKIQAQASLFTCTSLQESFSEMISISISISTLRLDLKYYHLSTSTVYYHWRQQHHRGHHQPSLCIYLSLTYVLRGHVHTYLKDGVQLTRQLFLLLQALAISGDNLPP